MFANPEGPRGDLKSPGCVGSVFFIEVDAAEEVTVLRCELGQGLSHRAPGFFAHQGIERTPPCRPGFHPLHPREGPVFPSPRAVMMQAKMGGGLKDKRGQGIGVLDPAVAEGLGDPAENFLGQVFGEGWITQPAGSEDAKPFPEPRGEALLDRVGYRLVMRHSAFLFVVILRIVNRFATLATSRSRQVGFSQQLEEPAENLNAIPQLLEVQLLVRRVQPVIM